MDKLKKEHASIKRELKNEIIGLDVGVTHDGWTSLNTESFETITCSFFSDWELKCKVLSTSKVEGSHTSENIMGVLQNCKDDWQFNSVIGVADNASNEVKAFQLLEWPRIACIGHNINLVVNAGLKEMSRLVGKARSLASFFHHSSLAMGLLHEKQKDVLDKEFRGHKIINDCITINKME